MLLACFSSSRCSADRSTVRRCSSTSSRLAPETGFARLGCDGASIGSALSLQNPTATRTTSTLPPPGRRHGGFARCGCAVRAADPARPPPGRRRPRPGADPEKLGCRVGPHAALRAAGAPPRPAPRKVGSKGGPHPRGSRRPAGPPPGGAGRGFRHRGFCRGEGESRAFARARCAAAARSRPSGSVGTRGARRDPGASWGLAS